MSAEIKERLKTTSEACLKCYEAWDGNDKDIKAREALQDAIHELRKVASRLEIELAISERDQMAQKPIPIPPHRDSRGGKNRGNNNNKGGNKGSQNDQDDNAGNANNNNNNNNSGPKVEIQKKPRGRSPKKSSGGEN